MIPSPSSSSASSPRSREEYPVRLSKPLLIHQQILRDEELSDARRATPPPFGNAHPMGEDELNNYDISQHLNMDMFANSPPPSPHSTIEEEEERSSMSSGLVKLESPPTSHSASDEEGLTMPSKTNSNGSTTVIQRPPVPSDIASFPPPGAAIQPDFDASLFDNTSDLKYGLKVDDLPAKSRVETQIKANLYFYPPPKETMVHLPTDTISKPKLQLKSPFEPSDNTLMLDTVVVCDSDRRRQVTMCLGCIKRERKRAFRKKVCLPAEEQHWSDHREKRVIVFNCREVVDIGKTTEITVNGNKVQATRLELPMRLACYCRHHAEKIGFRAYFTVSDSKGNVVARASSTPVMITDDHKAASSAPPANVSAMSSAPTTAPNTAPSSNYSSKVTTPVAIKNDYGFETPSAPPPVVEDGSDSSESSTSLVMPLKNRKRKNSDDSAPLRSAPRETEWSSSSSSSYKTHKSRNSTTSISSASGMLSPPALTASGTSTAATSPQSCADSYKTGVNTAFTFRSSPSKTELASSLSLANEQGPVPTIQRVIPGSGPIRGGIEVTLLGNGFVNGLVARFGDNRSPVTQCWNSSTVVAHLPPAQLPGPVVVTFEGWAMSDSQIFTYYDDTDQQLIELALQVVGIKMNGRLEDAREIAKRIIGSSTGLDAQQLQQRLSSSYNGVQFTPMSLEDLEELILSCIDAMDRMDNGRPIRLGLTNREGQTLLHLAARIGLDGLCAVLLDRGVAYDVTDNDGYTALHFAALGSHEDIIEMLVRDPVDLLKKSLSGKTVIDVADESLRESLLEEHVIRSRRNSASASLADSGTDEDNVETDGDDEGNGRRRSSRRGISGYISGLRDNARNSYRGLMRRDMSLTRRGLHQQNFWNYFRPDRNHQSEEEEDTAPPPAYDEIFPNDSARVDYSRSVLDDQDVSNSPSVSTTPVTKPKTDTEQSSKTNADEEPSEQSEEEMLEAWKQRQKQLNKDKMLFFFWLPVFIFTLVWFSMRLVSYINTMDTEAVKEQIVDVGRRVMNIRTRPPQIMRHEL
uniref:ARAD1C42350p n=1 Tax=Blastobotrys adeninivorans TaxID=409370 RepID=A0A060T4N3_BLAAD